MNPDMVIPWAQNGIFMGFPLCIDSRVLNEMQKILHFIRNKMLLLAHSYGQIDVTILHGLFFLEFLFHISACLLFICLHGISHGCSLLHAVVVDEGICLWPFCTFAVTKRSTKIGDFPCSDSFKNTSSYNFSHKDCSA